MDRLIVPPDRVTGCLPRKSRYGDLCARFEEAIEIIPREHWREFIGKVSAKGDVRDILDQDRVGSCAAESGTGGLMAVRVRAGQPHVLLNGWFPYYHTSGGVDRGSSIDETLEFLRLHGCTPEAIWPRSKGWRTKPSEEAYAFARHFRIQEYFDLGSIVEIGTALLKGFVIPFGWQGHSCLLVELLSETQAIYANSWGRGWGDDGFGVISLDRINLGYGAFAYRTANEADAAIIRHLLALANAA